MRRKFAPAVARRAPALSLIRTASMAAAGLFLAFSLLGEEAAAGDLSYSPVNPSFGGSPLNSSYLLGTADAQNQPKLREQKRIEARTNDPISQFTSTLQSRLLSSVSDKIADAIYGTNAASSGTFVVSGTTVSFQRVGNSVQLVLSDGIKTTNITLPAN
jgi:curli production assembly/transport component CsgF